MGLESPYRVLGRKWQTGQIDLIFLLCNLFITIFVCKQKLFIKAWKGKRTDALKSNGGGAGGPYNWPQQISLGLVSLGLMHKFISSLRSITVLGKMLEVLTV